MAIEVNHKESTATAEAEDSKKDDMESGPSSTTAEADNDYNTEGDINLLELQQQVLKSLKLVSMFFDFSSSRLYYTMFCIYLLQIIARVSYKSYQKRLYIHYMLKIRIKLLVVEKSLPKA